MLHKYIEKTQMFDAGLRTLINGFSVLI